MTDFDNNCLFPLKSLNNNYLINKYKNDSQYDLENDSQDKLVIEKKKFDSFVLLDKVPLD